MESSSLCDSLLKWLETFSGREGITLTDLTDGVVMADVLHQIAPEYYSGFWLSKIKADVGDNWRLKVSNLRKVQQGIVDYYQEQLNQNIKHFPLPDFNKIGEHGDPVEMGRMLQLILGCAVNCENKQQYIEAIMNMEERVQKVIMEAIQELMLREGSPGALGDARLGAGVLVAGGAGPASFHPHIKQILEQLESSTQARDELVQRCHELEQQISVVTEEKRSLATENEKLGGRLDAWEMGGGELGGNTSTLRYRDLKKQIDALQDELFKLETSRDDYRVRAENLERANQEVMSKNEELQTLADQARGLKDEVDALREMSERAVVYEGTMETYKKKLEELSDLRRQVRILEDKNSDYVQHNMELEEEVKKSGTWRPQLELYKKQVSELHQRLADEAKSTDRHAFDNKKLIEKMEAVTQEKDRMAKERDALKETIEELRCHVSALTSPDTSSSRPPSDLSDVDLLDVVPHQVRERLIRLQHENSMLKQRAAEGGSSEQLPVLQTLVADLQERQASLTQENRWELNRELNGRLMGSLSPPKFPSGFSLAEEVGRIYNGSSSPPIMPPGYPFFDARFSPDMGRKIKAFKRTLKWASESDLLVLRQPKGLLSTNFLTSPLPSLQPRSLPPVLPGVASSTQTCKEPPIVIRHIHEFKMSPSPTNEDSGCCRTSPSSCEETGEGNTPDYPGGTLDSGISGIYSGTLESGISGAYRCLSPVIPSIVEECTTHHVTDILPAIGGHRVSSPNIMHHSHPAHTSCVHCCSDNGEGSGRETGRVNCASPLPPPPRPHSVCSYNPPYKYTHCTSPSPNPSKQPSNSSPPPSPHNHSSISLTSTTSPVSSLGLPTTIIDLSLVHTPSLRSSLPKPSIDRTSQSTITPVSSTIQVSVNGLPVSPQGRRTGSGFSRPSVHPESPTPHNSPRLPNSIYATRSRSGKSLSSIALNEAVIKDRPVTQATLVCRSSSPEKSQNNQLEVNKGNSEIISAKIYQNGHLSDSQSPAVSKTRQSPSSIVKMSEQGQGKAASVGDIRKTEGVILSSLPPLPKRSSDKDHKAERSDSSDSASVREKEISGTKKLGQSKADTSPALKKKDSLSNGREYRAPSYPAIKNGNGRPGTDSLVRSSTTNPQSALTSKKLSEKKSLTPKSNNSPVTKVRNVSGNHVKFREPVVSQVSHSGSSTPTAHYSPASPRERMSPPPKNPHLKPLRPTDSPKNRRPNQDVKLVSDTLFTRFEITPGSQKKSDSLRSATDTDTDLDTLERKLTMGMYAAPLVSSESCTSVSPDDGEGDPSATDYCTDNGSDTEYDPGKFQPFRNNTLTEAMKAKAVNVTAPDETKGEKPEGNKEDEAENITNNPSSIARTYSFFRKHSKTKKQRMVPAKEASPLPPLTASGGVVKVRNKTKVMVAETFNAMFTLCTP